MKKNEVSPKEKWTTIARFSALWEAELAKSFLESQGIQCRLRDQYLIGMNLFYSQALGGVRLDVLSDQSEKAAEWLQAADQNQLALKEGESGEGLFCPQCQSLNTEMVPSRSKGLALILLFLFNIPFPFLARDHWKCRDCQKQWSVRSPIHPMSYLIPILLVIGLILMFR